LQNLGESDATLLRGPLAAVEVSRNESHAHEVEMLRSLHLLNDRSPDGARPSAN
jgi:hypothetical protein